MNRASRSIASVLESDTCAATWPFDKFPEAFPFSLLPDTTQRLSDNSHMNANANQLGVRMLLEFL